MIKPGITNQEKKRGSPALPGSADTDTGPWWVGNLACCCCVRAPAPADASERGDGVVRPSGPHRWLRNVWLQPYTWRIQKESVESRGTSDNMCSFKFKRCRVGPRREWMIEANRNGPGGLGWAPRPSTS